MCENWVIKSQRSCVSSIRGDACGCRRQAWKVFERTAETNDGAVGSGTDGYEEVHGESTAAGRKRTRSRAGAGDAARTLVDHAVERARRTGVCLSDGGPEEEIDQFT